MLTFMVMVRGEARYGYGMAGNEGDVVSRYYGPTPTIMDTGVTHNLSLKRGRSTSSHCRPPAEKAAQRRSHNHGLRKKQIFR